jgi:hypothetical protein
MKKILVIFALLALAIGVQAQDATIKKAGKAGYYVDKADTLLTPRVAAYNYVVKLDVDAPYYYSYGLKLIDNTGSNTSTVVLAGSLDNVYYKTISTLNYAGNGADTTIIGNITANPLSYPYLRFTITPTDTMWVKSLFINVVPTK